MADAEARLLRLVERLPPTPEERALAVRTDPAAVELLIEVLIAAAYWLNAAAVGEYGGRLGPARDRRLVEQVVAAAFQTFGGADPHPTSFDKAAMLLRGITQGHPFNDGNKRTGMLIAAYFLDLLGSPIPARFDTRAAEGLCVRVSSGELRDIAVIAEELRRLWEVDATTP